MDISDFNLLNENEEKDFNSFLERFNDTSAAYPKDKTVVDFINLQVKERSNETALIFKGKEISYQELGEKSDQIAGTLQQAGVKKASIVGLLFDKSLEMIYAILGVIKAGGAYLPMDPMHPESRLKFIIEDSNAKILLSHQAHSQTVAKLADSTVVDTIVFTEEVFQNKTTASFNQPMIDPDDTVYVIYTSGSTGKPKGCKISHRNVVRLLFNDKIDFDFSEKDVWIMAHAYYFDFSVWEMYGALMYGGKLVVPHGDEVKDVGKLHNLVKTHCVTVFNQTPLAFNFFIEEEEASNEHKLGQHLRYIIFGGDKLDPQKLQPWTKHYSLNEVKLINMYGITETTVHVSYYELTEDDIKNAGVSPIGRPLPETTIYILNDNLQPVPFGIVGEMYVGGTGVCKGYLNREELTKERFIDNPFSEGEKLYKTGDQARWTEDGRIEYIGRIDFQVKIRGYRIELGEIENALSSIFSIKQAVVIALKNKEEHELIAYLVSPEKQETANLRDNLLKLLPDYMVPAHFVQIDKIPLTPNGKLDKQALPNPYEAGLTHEENYVAPTSELEQTIASIWEEQLNRPKIGIKDNFFTIGGDSLKAIRVTSQINKKIDSSLRISDIFSFPTIEKLVANWNSINEGNDDDRAVGLEKINQIKIFIEENNFDELPEKYADIYPLTTIEKGMIFSSMLRPEEPVYYDQFCYNLEIKNKAVFLKAFELMVQKHPILRSLYYMNTFLEAVKVEMNTIDLPITFEDITKHSQKEQEQTINAYLKKDTDARLAFEGDLLWHLKSFLTEENRFYLVWTVHHAMLDGWSENSFVSEFANLCANPDVMELKALPPLASTFKDYTAIQIGREVSGKAVDFWKNYLAGYTRNKLPFNLSGKKISDELGMVKIQRSFKPEVSKAIERLKEEYQFTSKTICLSAYAYLMSIISSEKDVVSGVVSNDRPEIEDADKILGCFLNTVPFRINFGEIKTYRQLIEYFGKTLQEMRKHEIYLVDIAKSVGEKSSGNPLFDCIFNYTDFYILEDIEDENNALSYADEAHQEFEFIQNNLMTNTLFDVEIDRTHGEYSIGIKYAPAYFRAEDVKYTIELYENILMAFATQLDKKMDTSDLLSEEDKDWWLNDFNNTVTSYDKSVLMHQLFEQQVEKTPDLTALKQHGKSLTYREVNAISNQIADALIQHGAKPGENIGVICDRNFWMIHSLMAVLKAGGAYVPIDPSYPLERQDYILSNSNARFILVDSDYEITLRDSSKTYINVNELDLNNYKAKNPSISVTGTDLAYTIYTSGSTGRPKGVMIAHHSAVNLINWVNTTFNVNENDRLLFITSMCFDLSVYDIFGILATGGSIVVATQDEVRDPETLMSLMVNEKITFWDAVPTTMNYLVDMIELLDKSYSQEDLRLVFMSGDWIPVTLPERISNYFPNAKNISLGGATEGTVWSNFYPIKEVNENQTSIPYGKPIDNNFFYILDDNQKLVPRGVSGELYIGGDGVALGYANEPEKTAAAFFDDPYSRESGARMYKTGDLGRILPDGNMEFLGRKDFQVKIRGFRVELGEIENQLQKHAAVHRAVVLAKDDGNNTKFLCAYVVLNEPTENDALRKHLAKELPEYMIPSMFMQIDKIPITSNGKIDRKALPEPSDKQNEQAVEQPETKLENELEAIWKGILGAKNIGRNENVFELGAHSLHAGAFVSKLSKSANLSMTLRELFTHPTIAEQASLLEKGSSKKIYSAIESIAEAPYYEISHAQRRLWLIDQISGGKSTEYNLPMNYRIEGGFNRDAFEDAIYQVMQRHEILRTSIQMVENEPKQFVENDLRPDIEQLSMTNEEEITSYMLDQASLPFDLAIAPLFRIKIIRKDDQTHFIHFVMHHIISDGWSMGILMREIFSNYHALSNKKLIMHEALSVQYKDFAKWQNDKLAESDSKSSQSYWAKKMGGEIPVLELPTKGKRPNDLTNEAARIHHIIDADTVKKIKTFCQRHQVSTFMFLQAVVKALFYRYTGQTDIILGSPVAGREHDELADQIGFYVNTLVLRDQFNADDAFESLLKSVKETVLEAFDHQSYPYDKLVDELGVPRTLNRNALFDVMLVMQNIEDRKHYDVSAMNAVNTTLLLEKMDIEDAQSKFDITFNFFESDTIAINLEYRKILFEDEFMSSMVEHLCILINQVISNAKISLNELELVSKEEQEQLISFNPEPKNFPLDKSIIQLIEENVAKWPERIAVVSENENLDYRTLNQKANAVAHVLMQKGIQKGDVVACMLPKSPALITTLLGILKVGAVYLPVDIKHPEDRINYVLKDSAAKLVFHVGNWNDGINISTIIENEYLFETASVSANDLAYIIYTSGSTGQPKGVMVSHRSAVNMGYSHKKAYGIHENSRVLLFASPAFDASIGEILPPLLIGGSIVSVEENRIHNIKSLYQIVNDYGITALWLTPAFINLLDEKAFNSLETMVSVGEPAIPEDADRFSKVMNFVNGYGPTETTVFATTFKVEPDADYESIPIGYPVDNSRMYVVNEKNKIQPIGVPGELCIAGEGVSMGYLNRPELTAEKFTDNPFEMGKMYRSGDLVKWNSKGYIEYLGRIDEQIKLRGYRIELGEIEHALRSHSSVQNAKVILYKIKQESFLVAYYVTTQTLELQELKTHLANFLPDYMIPSNFIVLDKMPMNANGKVDKTKLPKVEQQSQQELTPPENEVEEELISIWKSILGIQEIGATHHFFELGGNSLKAIQVINKIREEMSVELSVKEIFGKDTIRELADIILEKQLEEFGDDDILELLNE